MPGSLPAIFVSSQSTLSDAPGGPSICTREFIRTLEGCGFELTIVPFGFDKRITSRIRRRLFGRAYAALVPAETLKQVVDASRSAGITWIFLNFRDSITMAPALRAALPDARIIHLSHGADSTDYLHELRAQANGDLQKVSGRAMRLLGDQLIQECHQRQSVDDVICLSETDKSLEYWFGSPRATWVPRAIAPDPLDWQPVQGRIGFVGSMEHPPNFEGLERFIEAITNAGADFELRISGGPASIGRGFARHPQVTYLGRLGDNDLRAEAATWNCFIHPLFCYARGASTKLATAIAWQIPIVTTRAGTRGYCIPNGLLPTGETPAALAAMTERLLNDPATRQTARDKIIELSNHSHSLDDSITMLGEYLGLAK